MKLAPVFAKGIDQAALCFYVHLHPSTFTKTKAICYHLLDTNHLLKSMDIFTVTFSTIDFLGRQNWH